MAIRAASIWREVIHPGSRDLMPKLPKESSAPLVARPLTRPLCIFLNFVLFGCNMISHLFGENSYFLFLRLGSLSLSRRGPFGPGVRWPFCSLAAPWFGERSLFPYTSPLKIHTLIPMIPYTVSASESA